MLSRTSGHFTALIFVDRHEINRDEKTIEAIINRTEGLISRLGIESRIKYIVEGAGNKFF
ncbi:MAG: hypothetical protein A2V46_01335 [Bacteroidetes bacterium RBG_19FT_COMBO_42_7]|nr:MAG: hypothetical protein A2Y71_11835 [Bacteroidetes bacterium RBG_13_42_15]OFY82786.1 MAG: hypothetical protein A2V46_01335 [Bacteroidetes bacterium RBG_19FT_COMBO_42_7]